MTKIAILGRGKMGAAIAALAAEHECTVVAHLGRAETQDGITTKELNGADVVVEFTAPAEAGRLVGNCIKLGVPVVSGTTGWDAERAKVEAAAHASRAAFLWAPNFSVGVHLFGGVVANAARGLANAGGFDARIVETHHTEKKDAPSGTAKMLAGLIEQATGRAPAITSVRTPGVPGTHEVIFDAPFEQVRLVHEALDRQVFAVGALKAAVWLAQGKRTGVFTMDDLLGRS